MIFLSGDGCTGIVQDLTEILVVRVIRSITDMPGETINRFAPNFSETADRSDRFAILGIDPER